MEFDTRLQELRAQISTEVLLPRALTWDEASGAFAFETRSWQLRAVVHCTGTASERRRVQSRCVVEEAALIASAFPQSDHEDPSQVVRVLQQMSEGLSQVSTTLTLRSDGRLVSIETEGLPRGSATETRIGTLMSVQLERAITGLVIERPPNPADTQWVEYASPLLRFPEIESGAPPGASQLIHRRAADPFVVDAAGSASLVDPGNGLQMSATIRSQATFDATDGRLRSRTWSVDGEASGVVVYHHAGVLRRLADGETVDLGRIERVRAPGEATPADLPAWPEL